MLSSRCLGSGPCPWLVATVPLVTGPQAAVAAAGSPAASFGGWPVPQKAVGLSVDDQLRSSRRSSPGEAGRLSGWLRRHVNVAAAAAPVAEATDTDTDSVRDDGPQRSRAKGQKPPFVRVANRRQARREQGKLGARLGGGRFAEPVSTATEDDVGPEERESFEVEGSPDGRLDVYLSQRYQQSRSYLEALIDRGAVLVNGHPKKKSFRNLRAGDVVDVRFLADQRTMPLRPEPIPLDVLFEDDDILVVNKPAGLVVHPAPGHWNGTLVNAVMHHLGLKPEALQQSEPGLPPAPPGPESSLRPGIVHRLDVGTTGVVTVAKTVTAFAFLSAAFARREVRKTYLAVTAGCRKAFRFHKPGGGHYIEHPIGRSTANRRRMAVVSEAHGGRASQSRVRAIAEDNDTALETALVEVSPLTGRTHQIRVHLAEEHAHVLGDTTYGSPANNRRFAQLACRPMLHAWRLSIPHPRMGTMTTFQAPLPEDMSALVRRMTPFPEEEEYMSQLLG